MIKSTIHFCVYRMKTRFHIDRTKHETFSPIPKNTSTAINSLLHMCNAHFMEKSNLYRIPEPENPRTIRGYSTSLFELAHHHADPIANKIRSNLNSWLESWPSKDWSNIESRLTSQDSNFLSCAWELYIAHFLIDLGYELESIGVTADESRPDFLVQGNNGAFIVEASTLQLNDSDQKRNDEFNKIIDSLDLLGNKRFRIHLSLLKSDVQQIKHRHLATQVNDWLESLQDEIEFESKIFSIKGWEFEITPLPFENPTDRFVAFWGDRTVSPLVSDEGFANKLESKASKYKHYEAHLPRVLFLANTKGFIGDYEWQINNALFGSDQKTINRKTGESHSSRAQNGLAIRNGQRLNRDLDGVVATPSFDLLNPSTMSYTYWLLPNSTRDGAPDFPFPTWRLDGEYISKFNFS